jgi:hypothetical protein
VPLIDRYRSTISLALASPTRLLKDVRAPEKVDHRLKMMVNGSGLADDAAKQEGVGLAQPVPPQAAVVIAAPPSHTAAGQTVTVVQAMPVAPPTTRKGPGSREAIVIGFANNPEVFQVAMKDAPWCVCNPFIFSNRPQAPTAHRRLATAVRV